ncbi:DUF1003 domain-containing protein [Aeromicrobium alkaliterrae]|uniref:DUF1003 domain-containing protein n=1 Tax=Aeromicrobium alkaliterrae TaxID=302168 RepID=A0ABN2KAB0_9ACTN
MAEQSRRDADRQSRLDQPRDRRRGWRPRTDFDTERFGRFAESFARFMGTATFLAGMTVFIIVWLVWNVVGPEKAQWDPYPFIFLTLILSLQASYAAPLILLAQNRQEARDRVQQQQDRDADAQSHADMEFLAREVASLRLGLGEVATRDFLRSELRGLVEALDPSDDAERRDKPKKDKRSTSD